MTLINSKVEVYSTNVTCPEVAKNILEAFRSKFESYEVNFDLEDCDRILRIASTVNICNESVFNLLKSFGYNCD